MRRVWISGAVTLALGSFAMAQNYVGDQACSTCHANNPETGFFDGYMRSGHPWKIFHTVGSTPAVDTWPFTPVPPLPVVGGIQLGWPDIEYVIGNYYWKTRLIDPQGYIYTGNADETTQWNVLTEEWVPYHAGEIDKPFNCGRCHTTGYDPAGNQGGLPGLIGTWTQDGVRCEACHGPAGDHIGDPFNTPPPGGLDCADCHYRDSEFRMPWKGGFMRHHQQSEDLSHSPHANWPTCTTCHDQHKSTVYGEGGMTQDCSNCHAGNEENNFHMIEGMGSIDCIDCHMPFMAKSGQKFNEFTGDVRGHLFQIMTDPIAAVDNVYDVDGSLFWNQDMDGQSYVTLDYACDGCHIDIGESLPISGYAAYASNIHTRTPMDFDISLHGTRKGKPYWYNEENGGFESFTGVPIEELGCVECHGPNDADGNPNDPGYEPGCSDCHQSADWSVEQAQCLTCHGRQKTEIMALGYTDVHRDMGFQCWDCHGDVDMHGDGETEFDSMLQPGAITADCEDCHDNPPPGHSGHDGYDPHNGKLHCTACHAQTVISCYNCHFESQVESHVKRAKQPLHDFVLLVNREKDNKVYTGSFQSLTYEGDSFVAFAPMTSHSITAEGRECTDCHNAFPTPCQECHTSGWNTNAAVTEYNDTGQIKFVTWDDDTKTLSWIRGVIPMPVDYEQTFKMDFLTYTGPTTDPPPGDPNLWTGIGEDTWDGHQFFFGTPLTEDQMASIGMFPAGGTPCPQDISGDGRVGFDDLLEVLSFWGPCADPGNCPQDISGDGVVGFDDLLEVLSFWGPCPEP